MKLPARVTLVEVGPRDGLQNEPSPIPTDIKIDFIKRLAGAGLATIEATSFVSPKKIPQLADHTEVIRGLNLPASIQLPALVPNVKGFNNAVDAGVKHIAVFASVSETFSQRNIHCSIEESFVRFTEVIALAKQHHIPVRGYLSCVFGCPYEGKIADDVIVDAAKRLLDLGCTEISLGDTIGVATPKQVREVIAALLTKIPAEKLAGHFHDTYGQAIANIVAALELGLSTFDSSAAGLGGCPYAAGASGNVATEDVVYLMQGLGIETGVDLEKLIAAGHFICQHAKTPNRSKVAAAMGKK
ncbi:MAG: hydroxymethylglutaryl-CoA lyase [marine bacterium B5-7]|nr:MAG: hydroxymethylglutaryl-CoA lyase [marine bacterium B5-7]